MSDYNSDSSSDDDSIISIGGRSRSDSESSEENDKPYVMSEGVASKLKLMEGNVDEDDDDEEDPYDDDDYEEDAEGIDEGAYEEQLHGGGGAKKSTVITETVTYDDSDDDDEDDEEDDTYLQKFKKDVSKDYIMKYHPETQIHNSDEVEKLSKVVRNEEGIPVDPLHRTIPYLTKYERARVLGQRAAQIENGAKPYIKVPENIIDGYVIAEMELQQKKIPVIIRRPLPSGASEYWKLEDLELVNF